MEPEGGRLVPDAVGLDRTEGVEYMRSGALAVMQAIPFGGAFAQLLGDTIRSRRQRRYEEFVKAIAHALEVLQDRIDEARISTDEFADLVEDVEERLQTRRAGEMRDFYAAAIGNALTPQRPDPVEQERMLATLGELRPSHLWLLHLIETTTEGPPDMYIGGVDQVIAWRAPSADIQAIKRDWADLARNDLVQAYPQGMLSGRGAGDLSQRLTAFGSRFIAFVTLPTPEPGKP